MTIPVLICDDSSFARKQMVRSLPANWDIDIHFASNGLEALAAIREGHGDILFLDLNMPVLDGYGTLQAIVKDDLPTMVIVVSGDIQPEARKAVKRLGAIDFIEKPTDKETVKTLLENYGLLRPEDCLAVADGGDSSDLPETLAIPEEEIATDINQHLESYKEVANVAMGQAGDLLARLLNVKVKMPIPNVNLLAISELHMVLKAAAEQKSISAVCQGYTGAGIAGEAMILFYDSSFQDFADLMNYTSVLDDASQRELLVDLANILIGAFLKGLSDQIDVDFSQSHPKLLGQHLQVNDLLANNAQQWENILAIEINYVIESHNIQCDLLLLLTEESLQILNQKISHLLNNT